MPLNPYLSFNGNAEEALDHYRSALGGEAQTMRWGGSPAESHAPPDWKDKIMHARLETPFGVIMVADSPQPGTTGGNVSIAVHADTNDKAEAVFAKLSQGGEVTMPIGKSFFAERFGMCTDKFGIGWMVVAGGQG
jgi:PhnB protein